MTDKQPTSVAEALQREITRVRDSVMPAYQHPLVKNAGAFALRMMRADLDAAVKALAEGDAVACVRLLDALKGYGE